MCSFIILLLLLCKNNGNSDDNCRRNGDNYYYHERNDDYPRGKDKDCGCSACEDGTLSEESPIMEREDIWTSYKNTSSGKPCK